ncbi:MAG: tryptophan--tRNA ligase [Euryarchaeota archaeon RBG_19FT_COMBO_69_17]|nr:MAG: tryptophan--tRNA ligase [Euryarchaeota archaeon RBG_19FT_COMBO_69_17]
MPEDFVVTPWEVKGQVDYDRLVTQFGTERITPALLERVRQAAGDLHPMLRRGVFYSHRDLGGILDRHDKGLPFALYTGRGPSSGIHIGHMLPWFFTKWLQEKFGATLYFQITDDEKFLFKDFEDLGQATKVGYENVLDIIAMGFEPKRTRIFLDTEYIHHLYPIAVEVAKRITFSTTQAVFGFENSNNIGEIFYTSIQAAPAFLPTRLAGQDVPVLIPCGIDQDPHFRVARDVAPRLGYPKPALIHNKLLPSLTGPGGKMSASVPESSIFTTDSLKDAKKKITNAFTGGRATVEEQRRLGADPDICSVFAFYNFVFEPDDGHLAEVERTCRSGERLCGDCKLELWGKVESFLRKHKEAREKAKDRIDDFLVRD